MKRALPLFLLLASCSQTRNQWVLQSYDQGKGYVFMQNGVSYQAICFAKGRPLLPNGEPDTDPEALPPKTINYQSECADILTYLHKPIPGFSEVGTSLIFTEQGNYKLEFLIEKAK